MNEELVFIIDFLIELLKHAQVFDIHAISLGTHLLKDFYDKSRGHFMTTLINNDERENPAEFHFVNLDLRSKVFIHYLFQKKSE